MAGQFLEPCGPQQAVAGASLSTFDIPFVYQFSYTYDLPVGRGKALLGNMPALLDAIVGGWKTNGVWRVADGRPITPFTYDGVSLPTYGGQRPNIVARPTRTKGADSVWINNYFANPQAFQLPPMYAFGNAPRATGMVRTPWAFNTNMSVEKDFPCRSCAKG